jgi:hypothetical protein
MMGETTSKEGEMSRWKKDGVDGIAFTDGDGDALRVNIAAKREFWLNSLEHGGDEDRENVVVILPYARAVELAEMILAHVKDGKSLADCIPVDPRRIRLSELEEAISEMIQKGIRENLGCDLLYAEVDRLTKELGE